MRLELVMQQRQVMRPQLSLLSPVERAAIQLAQRLWESKPHFAVSLPIAVLQGVLLESLGGQPKPTSGLGSSEVLEEEFIFVNAEEMAVLGDVPSEVGISLAGCIFVLHDVPDDFLPLIVFNLAINKHLSDDNPVSALFEKSGINHDFSKHWTANIIDILLAEKYFADHPEKFQQYLAWRKPLERTDFFHNELVDKLLGERISRSNYRRTTHPLKRGYYCRHSWNLSKSLDGMLGRSYTDKFFRDHLITKPDIILKRASGEDNFNPELMVRLLEHIEANAQKVKRGKQVVVPAALEPQAYLLCKDIVGEAAILVDLGDGVYGVKARAEKTITALKDKLAYFFQQSVKALDQKQASPIGEGVMRLVTLAKATLELEGVAGRQEILIDLSTASSRQETGQSVGAVLEQIEAQLHQLYALAAQFYFIEEKLAGLGEQGIDVVPGILQEDSARVSAEIEKLQERKGACNTVQEALGQLAAARAQMHSLLGLVP